MKHVVDFLKCHFVSALLLPCIVFAADIDLSNEPLAIRTTGVEPNIMFLMDDSGSMKETDVFYAPGYDSDNNYRCSSGTVIDPVVGKDIVVYVSKKVVPLVKDYTGTPYFSYNGLTYSWGESGNADVAAGTTAPAVCFDPEATYSVRLKAEVSTYIVKEPVTKTVTEYYCNGNDTLQWSNWNKRYECRVGRNNSYIAFSRQVTITKDEDVTYYHDYLMANGTAQLFTGNFLNWYFSSTESQFSDLTLAGGYKTYSGNYWSSTPAANFVTSTANTVTMGLKPNVHYGHDRISVAVDVTKMLIRKLTGVNISLGSFHTQGDATKVDSQNGYLMHGFVPLLANDETKATENNKISLIQTIANLSAKGDTPTSESMVRMASYFFTGFETKDFDYYNGAARTKVTKKINDVLKLSNDATDAVAYKSGSPIFKDDLWCQKNAIAVLTDGEPTNDESFGGSNKGGLLWTYNALGTNQEDNSAYDGKEGIMRVPGALFDHDWLKDMRGTQNIESFFIAFGSDAVQSSSIFTEAGKAGGGGVDNSFAATDGSAVINAFKKIVSNVMAASTSVTAVAVSSVAELQTENYAFQATYDTKYWTSEIKALNVNSSGLFVQPNGTGASKLSTGIQPEWTANKVMSDLYILNDKDIGGKNVAANYMANGVKDRRVYTWSGNKGIRFGSSTMTRPSTSSSSLAEFNALPQSLRDDLAVVTGSNGQEQYDLMMYLLGDIKNETNSPLSVTNKYRQRGTYLDADADGLIDAVFDGGLLGDIVNSSPVYVQRPSRPWNDVTFGTSAAKYSDFKALQKQRPAMVYAGANDGMLHAFTVEQGINNGIIYPKGAELFAYMPSIIASKSNDKGLHYLANPAYEHRYYVDLTVTPSDVFMDFYGSAGNLDPEWRTVLVGGLRSGGKGYYALDVTCPFNDAGYYDTADGLDSKQNTCANENSINENNVLWEFDNTDDADLGFTFSDPIIAKVNYDSGFSAGTERNGNGNGRWAAIVSNGYNSASGRAALYILFLDGGKDGVWTEGVDYVKLLVSDASTDTAIYKNGLSSPTAMDIDFDGMVDRVYAGDLKGQLWSFDLSKAADKTQYLTDKTNFAWVANKLFTTGASGYPQPITTAPMVSRDNSQAHVFPNVDPDLMVVFGTGQYLAESDLTNKNLQAVYGVHDRGVFNLTRYGTVKDGSTTYTMLEPRVFKQTTVNTVINRTLVGNPLNSLQFGWYVPLASDLNGDDVISGNELTGERLVFRSFLANELFVFNTIIPIVGSCSGATKGWTMAIDWTEGVAYKDSTYDANLSGYIDPTDQGYVGSFNEAAGSELGRGGSNIYDSVGDVARSQSFSFGSASVSERIGWEEKMPFGIKAK